MTSKVVWAAAVVIVVIIIAAFAYYFNNYVSPSPSPSQSPSPSPSVSPTISPSPSASLTPSPTISPFPSASPTVSPSPSPGQLLSPTEQADLNWAGYAVANNLSNPQPVVTGVSGSWVVPSVEISQNDTYSAVWIGIGGLFGHSLIQTGTEQDCVNGEVSYFAWYELLPNDSIPIEMDVLPEDTITASINLTNPTENMWSIYLSDVSTGQSFNQTVIYDSSQLSAEWVVERPDVNNALSTIANFGSVTLSNCTATINNTVKALGYFPSVRIFMYDMNGTRLVDTSNFSSDGSSFTVQYLTSG